MVVSTARGRTGTLIPAPWTDRASILAMSPSPSESPPPDAIEVWNRSYPAEAFAFVSDGLGHTASLVHGHAPHFVATTDEGRHVDGRQLCEGLRDFAIRRFGLMAPVVLQHWNIHRTDDFGRIVFAMIANEKLKKTDEDRIEDFFGVYDFSVAFSERSIIEALGAIRDEERDG
jgi:uncharacterized repeat protein (TIGR04138 family)